ncbi:hypothetical protein ACFYVR_11945 [Rhodococcus sp. NPDC003318]|uniref:hypothetical protein n=1 Tax=Rhodococcus sp. NPDC003318 TaxID=3364503 RepID=UPI0036B1B23E
MDLLTKTAESLWQVILVGLVLGAGLPALFACGLRLLGSGIPDGSGAAPTGRVAEQVSTTRRGPLAVIAAAVCFAIVVIAIATGILFIMSDFLDHTFGIHLF